MDYIAHTVTADYGSVHLLDEDGSISCVRLVFHAGPGVDHAKQYVSPAALPALIDQLVYLRDHGVA